MFEYFVCSLLQKYRDLLLQVDLQVIVLPNIGIPCHLTGLEDILGFC